MKESLKFERVKNWYEKNERRISSGSLVFGFAFDSFTLKNVDNLANNLWLSINLSVVGICIIILARLDSKKGDKDLSESKAHLWILTLLQFSLGAVLGAFFIFYFRSSALISAWPFMVLLLGAMISNELFQKKYARLSSQTSFFYFAVFLFLIFVIPVLLHSIGPWVFLLSGILSLILIFGFIKLLNYFAHETAQKSRVSLNISIISIFLLVNILYFTNLIPPIPLSLKDAGIYHSVSKNSLGQYILGEEDYGWSKFFHTRERFDLGFGASAYAWSSVYSPANLSTNIVHEWQYRNPITGNWETKSKITLPVSGGRDSGFRTYSLVSNLTKGDWRVNVATQRGQLIGRVSFVVLDNDIPKSTLRKVTK